jgi:hypothetical protein
MLRRRKIPKQVSRMKMTNNRLCPLCRHIKANRHSTWGLRCHDDNFRWMGHYLLERSLSSTSLLHIGAVPSFRSSYAKDPS